MAVKNPNVPQVNDPQLEADLLRVLRIKGPLGVLNVLDAIVPTVLMGTVRPFDFQVLQPTFSPGNIFSSQNTNAGVNTVLVDTGALPAGTYDCVFNANVINLGSPAGYLGMQHRNASNAATLSELSAAFGGTNATNFNQVMSIVVAANERFRWITDTVSAPTGQIASLIAVIIRS